MTESDQTAARPVAETASQNQPEREKLKFAPVSGFCEVCNREITKRDPVWLVGMWLACSQSCADELGERDQREMLQREAREVDAHPMRQVIADAEHLMRDSVGGGPPIFPPDYEDSFLHRDGWGDAPSVDVRSARRPRARMPVEPFADIAPHQSGSQTSRRSAEANASTMRSKMFLIYHHIKAEGRKGATRQELVDTLGISLQTVCGRVRRLYQMGLIGSNCVHGCRILCGHDVVARTNRMSGMDNEVLVHEEHVLRWDADQARPPLRPHWERAR